MIQIHPTQCWAALGLAVLSLSFPNAAVAEKLKKKKGRPLTLQRLFGKEEFKSKSFRLQWLEKGSRFTYLRDAKEENFEGGKEIWIEQAEGDGAELLVPASDLIPDGAEDPLTIDGYSLSEDLNLVLIYTNAQRVWRGDTRGDYWLLDRKQKELRQLGGESKPSSLMFAKLSPSGTQVAYVRDRNIFLEDLGDHSIRALTESASRSIFNGKFDWVYEEELGIRDGFRWSPDGSAIAYWQFDESGVRKQTLVDHVSELYPKVTRFGYPKAGQRNAACRAGIVEVASGRTTWMKVPRDPREHYLARMEWVANRSDRLVLQQLNRAQNTNLVLLAKRADGSVKTILKEEDPAWVMLNEEVHWVRGGKAFIFISERDGWRHLYLVTRKGKQITCLTPAAFDVIDLLSVDEAGKWIYFRASPGAAAERFLYRVGVDGNGLQRLTPASETRGTHSYKLSPDGKFAVLSSSNADAPPVTSLISLPDHSHLKFLERNKKLRRKVAALDIAPVEFFEVDLGKGVTLPAQCLKPPHFDSTKKYPLLVYVYGEPAGQVVRDSWGGSRHLWHQMLAQQGYVVMSFDNRGSNSPLGRAWRRSAFKKIGILPPQDQAAAVRAVLEARSYLDPERVGIWGWSGGGSMSLNAIFKYPGLYHTAMAVASVPDQRHYDTIYQERYMGRPQDNPKAFHKGSPLNFANRLQGNLLIVHGAADDNCHYQTYLKLVDKLIQHNKQFSMMTYPRGTHAIKEGKNTRQHLYQTMTRFLHVHLPAEP